MISLELSQLEQLAHLFKSACSFEVAFVCVEQEGQFVRNRLIFQYHFQLTLGDPNPHLIAAVYYENDSVNLIFFTLTTCV